MATITIRASDSAAALDEVMRQLGPDALILSTRQNRGQVEMVATSAQPQDGAGAPPPPPPAPAAAPGFAGHLRRQLVRPVADVPEVLPPHLPGRVVLAGPPGAGRSMLAARLAAEALRSPGAARPSLVAPRPDVLAPPGPLSAWARLAGLVPHRPVWAEGSGASLAPPDPGETQIVDLSALPQLAPGQLATLAALPEARLWLVLPAGLHASYQDRLCEPLVGIADLIVLTRTDLCPPTDDDLSLTRRHGLPVALLAQGGGLLDALTPVATWPDVAGHGATATPSPVSGRPMKDQRDAAARIS